MTDILDTRFDNKNFTLPDNLMKLGDDVNLTEKDPLLTTLIIAVGWDNKGFGGHTVDVDLSLFLLDRSGVTLEDQDFVFYNNPNAHNGAIQHEGDNKIGAGDGDNETVKIMLKDLPFDIMQIACVYSIYRGPEKNQQLGLIKNGYIRLLNGHNNQEYLRFPLDLHFKDSQATAAIVGSLNREGPKWHFTARMETNPGNLADIATTYGLEIIRQ